MCVSLKALAQVYTLAIEEAFLAVRRRQNGSCIQYAFAHAVIVAANCSIRTL
jgi:hypothetical protein